MGVRGLGTGGGGDEVDRVSGLGFRTNGRGLPGPQK